MAGRSTYCATCCPGAIVMGITRGSPCPRNSTLCEPASSCNVIGVLPRRTPSTNASAPAGFVVTTSVPVGDGAGTSAQNRRAPISATAPIATTPTAVAAATFTSFPLARRAGTFNAAAVRVGSRRIRTSARRCSDVSLTPAVFGSAA